MRFALFLGWRFLRSQQATTTSARLPRLVLTIAVLTVSLPVSILAIQSGYIKAIAGKWASFTFHNQIAINDPLDIEELREDLKATNLPDSLRRRAERHREAHLRNERPDGRLPILGDRLTIDEDSADLLEIPDPIAQVPLPGEPFVDRVIYYQQGFVLVSTPENVVQAQVRGIEQSALDYELLISSFDMLPDENYSPASLGRSEVILGEGLARRLGILPCDIPSPACEQPDNDLPLLVDISVDRRMPDGSIQAVTRPLTVVALFRTGYQQIDQSTMITTLDTSRIILGRSRPDAAGLFFDDISLSLISESALIYTMKQHYQSANIPYPTLGFARTITTFPDEHGNLLIALDYEKTQLTVITIALIVVAFLTVGLTMYVVVTEKQRQIAILMAMGVRPRQVEAIFVAEGMLIAGIGTSLGVLLGATAIPPLLTHLIDFWAHLRDGWQLILAQVGFDVTLDNRGIGQSAVYNPETLPYEIQMGDVVTLVGISMLVAAVMSYLPARRASRTEPVQVIRDGS